MKYILILSLLLGGCATVVPVKQKFPTAPNPLLEPCQPLKLVPKDAELSVLTKIVVDNYMQYYICSGTVNGWQEWYNTQQKIFNKDR